MTRYPSTILTEQILAVCPIAGVSIGQIGDKSTWRVDYTPEATAQQRTDAAAIVAAFDPVAHENAEAAIEAQTATIKADAQVASLLVQLKNSTLAQQSTYVDNNTPGTTIAPFKAEVRILLKRMIAVMALIARDRPI